MIEVIVFDLDDTLYDEIDYCRSGFVAVAEHLASLPGSHTVEQIFGALWGQFSAGNHSKTFDAAMRELAISSDDRLIGQLTDVYRNHQPAITLPLESRNVLDKLKRRYRLALLTDGFLPAQQLKVRALEIEHYFSSIVYTEQLGRQSWKPSPTGFEKIMRDLGVRAENMVYVADNEKKDFIAPNRLGFSTVQLIRPAGMHKGTSDKPGAKARHRIHKIEQIPALVDRL